MIDKWVVEFTAADTDYTLELDPREFPHLKRKKDVIKDTIVGLSEMGKPLQSLIKVKKKYLQ